MLTAKELRSKQRIHRRHPTEAERIFRDRLAAAGVDFKFQMIAGFFILEFVIPHKVLAIEIIGEACHDQMRDDFLRRSGFHVIHVHSDEVSDWPLDALSCYPDRSPSEFRSALGRASANKGAQIRAHRLGQSQALFPG